MYFSELAKLLLMVYLIKTKIIIRITIIYLCLEREISKEKKASSDEHFYVQSESSACGDIIDFHS